MNILYKFINGFFLIVVSFKLWDFIYVNIIFIFFNKNIKFLFVYFFFWFILLGSLFSVIKILFFNGWFDVIEINITIGGIL